MQAKYLITTRYRDAHQMIKQVAQCENRRRTVADLSSEQESAEELHYYWIFQPSMFNRIMHQDYHDLVLPFPEPASIYLCRKVSLLR